MGNKFRFDKWNTGKPLEPKTIICWNCGDKILANWGYSGEKKQSIYVCHGCNAPTVYNINAESVIGVNPGRKFAKLPKDIEKTYSEATSCFSINAYTAAVMLFRKILMTIAVEEGAKKDQKFEHYVKFLSENNIVNPKQKKQADKVRKMGNKANHKIENRTKEEAQEILKFIEILLITNYEYADEEEAEKEIIKR